MPTQHATATPATGHKPAARDRAPKYSTMSERAAFGKAARAKLPRSSLGNWAAPAQRPDPLGILEEQEKVRVPELVPIRHGRMAASPFAFFRGAAAVMASDLAAESRTELNVQLCADAHLVNFGGFASPDRDLLFDVNDFDETHPGPFEWDLKRLTASIEVAARERGFERALRQDVVAWAARAYREGIREFANTPILDIWYSRLNVAGIERRWGQEAGGKAVRNLQQMAVKAQSKDNLKAFDKLVTVDDGEIRFVSDPPLLVPVSELFSGVDAAQVQEAIAGSLFRYRATLAEDRRHLFDRYRFVDLARKVVGVGSVGTRCWVALLLGQDEHDPLFLQVKEAEASVLEAALGESAFPNHGQRVVEGQRIMQAASDIMLGWDRVEGPDGVTRDYYMRQLWDWKVSATVETMTPEILRVYAQICGWTLARAHARSGDATAIGAYLGASDTFDKAMVNFADVYAEQNDLDHRALTEAIGSGRMQATAGV
jgi:uncharacterized protein (DUF2252 family)